MRKNTIKCYQSTATLLWFPCVFSKADFAGQNWHHRARGCSVLAFGTEGGGSGLCYKHLRSCELHGDPPITPEECKSGVGTLLPVLGLKACCFQRKMWSNFVFRYFPGLSSGEQGRRMWLSELTNMSKGRVWSVDYRAVKALRWEVWMLAWPWILSLMSSPQQSRSSQARTSGALALSPVILFCCLFVLP